MTKTQSKQQQESIFPKTNKRPQAQQTQQKTQQIREIKPTSKASQQEGSKATDKRHQGESKKERDYYADDIDTARLFSRLVELESREKLANRLDISRSHLSRLINGNNPHPQKRTLDQVQKFLQVAESTWKAFINGDIDVDKLWEHRGESFTTNAQTDVDRIKALFHELELVDAIHTLNDLTEDLSTRYDDENKENEVAKEEIELSDRAAARLVTLYKMSAMTLEKEDKDKMKISQDLLKELENGNIYFVYEYSDYESLLPYLLRPHSWQSHNGKKKEMPIIDDYNKQFQSVEELLKILEE